MPIGLARFLFLLLISASIGAANSANTPEPAVDAAELHQCGDAQLALDYADGQDERLNRACLVLGRSRSCVDLGVEFFARTWLFRVECRGANVEITLPLSGNHPVYKTVRLNRQGNTLRLVGVEEPGMSPDKRDYSQARRLLSERKYEAGFAEWIEANIDLRCMGFGCRPSEQTQLLDLGSEEIAGQARTLYRARDIRSALGLIDAYFAFLGTKRVLTQGTAVGTAVGLADPTIATKLTPLLNDYAFYLAEQGEYARARPLLEAVVKAAADRWVAHLNLGDVLWALSEQDLARRHYAQYAGHVPATRWPKNLRERCASACR